MSEQYSNDPNSNQDTHRRNLTIAILVGLVLLLVTGVIGLSRLQNGDADASSKSRIPDTTTATTTGSESPTDQPDRDSHEPSARPPGTRRSHSAPSDRGDRSGSTSPGSSGSTSPGSSGSSDVRPAASLVGALEHSADYTGPCDPAVRMTVSGMIRVSGGPVQVRYRWWTGDSAGREQSISFTGTGVQTRRVTSTIPFRSSAGARQLLEILSPTPSRSAYAGYLVTCASAPVHPSSPTASIASISIDRSSATDTCATYVGANATAEIRVSSVPATVRYRWVWAGGGTPSDERVLSFAATDPTTKPVIFGFGFSGSGDFAPQLQVLSPNRTLSSPVHFVLHCTYGVTVSAPEISSTYYSGPCAAGVPFQATAYLRAAVTTDVQFRWVRDDGATSPVQAVTVRAGTATPIQNTWTLTAGAGRHWLAVQILSPVTTTSAQAAFTIACS